MAQHLSQPAAHDRDDHADDVYRRVELALETLDQLCRILSGLGRHTPEQAGRGAPS